MTRRNRMLGLMGVLVLAGVSQTGPHGHGRRRCYSMVQIN